MLRPRSVESLVNDLLPFAEFLTAQHPEVTTLRDLKRHHVEQFLIWNRTRSWRGPKARPQPVSAAVARAAVLSLRTLLEDIAAWGWAEAPARRLVFAVGIFPNAAAVIRLVGAILIDMHDEWIAGDRRHLSEESMALLNDPVDTGDHAAIESGE